MTLKNSYSIDVDIYCQILLHVIQGILQKAEALYHQGEFEKALVLYHRGSKLRPTLPEFRLGIHKTQEAINNCVDG